MDDFDVAVHTIVKQQTDYKARVKLLQAENEKLRKNLEDQLRTSKNLLNDELTKGERPTKFMRQTSLRSASVVQRLVANAASPRYISLKTKKKRRRNNLPVKLVRKNLVLV